MLTTGVRKIRKQGADLSSSRFGRLVVQVKSLRKDGKNTFWLCICDCGKTTEVPTARLQSGRTSSCGCWRDESRVLRAVARIKGVRREWRIWYGMIQRCHNPKNQAFPDYGARGISVHPSWRQDFQSFLSYMGKSEGREIDRVDNDGNYEPGNVRWTDHITNSNNKRSNRFIEHAGLRLTVTQWERRTGVKHWTITRRLDAGFTPGQIFGEA